jgi:hypothetical protein
MVVVTPPLQWLECVRSLRCSLLMPIVTAVGRHRIHCDRTIPDPRAERTVWVYVEIGTDEIGEILMNVVYCIVLCSGRAGLLPHT